MAMSRKHYRAFAAIIRERWDASAELPEVRGNLAIIIADLAYVFRADNSDFDSRRFRDACTGGE